MRNAVSLSTYSQTTYSRGRSGVYILLWWFIQGTLFRYSLHNFYGWRRFLLRLFGAQVGRGVKIRASAQITYPWKVTIGAHTWIGDNAVLYSLDNIGIGENCVISQHAYLCTGSHDMNSRSFDLVVKKIVVSNGAWVGLQSTILPGVTVGVMGVVGAKSLVNRDVGPNEVHYGIPAKFVKYRFVGEILNENEVCG